jgi:hypothetical protein
VAPTSPRQAALGILRGFPEQHPEIELLPFDRDFPVRQPRRFTDILDDARYCSRLPVDSFEAGPQARVQRRAPERVRIQADRTEGIAQLVAEHCDKLILVAIRLGRRHRFVRRRPIPVRSSI